MVKTVYNTLPNAAYLVNCLYLLEKYSHWHVSGFYTRHIIYIIYRGYL